MVAAWLLLLCATTLLTGGALYGDTVALGGLRSALAQADVAERSLIVTSEVPTNQAAALDAAIRPELERVVGPSGGVVVRVATAPAFADAAADPTTVTTLTEFASFQDIAKHATLSSGRWAEAGATPQEATLSEAAGALLNLHAGDSLTLVSRLQPTNHVQVSITGIWRPNPTDGYWLGDPLEISGSVTQGSYTQVGPFVIPEADIDSRPFGDRIEYEWRGVLDPSGVGIDDVSTIRIAATQLDTRIGVALAGSAQYHVTTGLPKILEAIDRSVLVSRTGVLVLVIQYAVLALYAIVLVAGMLADRRRAETALLRTRGASTGHLAAMGILEAILLTGSAAAIALFAAQLVVGWLVASEPYAGGLVTTGGVSADGLIVDAVTAVIGIIALSLPMLGGGPNLAGIRAAISRQTGSTLARRLGLDLALVVVAAIALWQLRQYGAPLTRNGRGVLGIDPLLVAAPAIGLLAGAVVATRLLPRVLELLEGFLERGRGLVGPMSARGLARRPLRYTRSALLLMLAAALGTFAVAHVATWTRSQGDQAAYSAGAAVRLLPSTTVASRPDLAAVLASLPGVDQVMPVDRLTVDAGRAVRSDPLLGVDADLADGVANPIEGIDPGTSADLYRQLVAARPAPAGIEVPAGSRAIGLVLDVMFTATYDNPTGEPPMPPVDLTITPGIAASVVVEDGLGRFHRLATSSDGLLGGTGQRLVVDLAPGGGAGLVEPVRIRAIELAFSAPHLVGLTGTTTLVGVEAASDLSTPSWQALRLAPGVSGWAWSALYSNAPAQRYEAPTGTWLLRFGVDPGDLSPLFGGFTSATLRLGEDVTTPPIAAIASGAFLAATGAAVGDTLTASLDGNTTMVHLIGELDAYPTLDPAKPFLVVDERTLASLRYAVTGSVRPPTEWWFASTDPASVAMAVVAGPDQDATIVTAAAQEAALLTDPISRGVIGVLGLGTWTALIFAAIGFVVSATVSTRERLGEFALLRALGLSGRQLSVWLALEHTFLLVTGILAGIALGVLLSWLVLPFATLTTTGAAVVPPPVVVIPWASLVPIVIAATAVLVASLVVLRVQLLRIRIGDVLRGRDE